ncbi:VWA domain-containing protein [Chloroflexia bacterium SDU3-3]|nr:VWA domain-containing protein [Chloroflexia bacterium SDU3-3]
MRRTGRPPRPPRFFGNSRAAASVMTADDIRFPHGRRPTMRKNDPSLARPVSRLLLTTALAALLAACGGTSAPVSAPSSGSGVPPASQNSSTSRDSSGTSSAPSGGEAGAPASGEAKPDAAGSTAGGAIGDNRTSHSQQGQEIALRAGEIDDNRDFADYQTYLRTYSGPAAEPMEVSERYVISVTDAQKRPVADATVRLREGDKLLFEGRTLAGGKAIVFPKALGASDGGALTVQVAQANAQVEVPLPRGQDSTLGVVLDGAAQPQARRLEVLFLLDATGSMGDEIAKIQRTIRSIAAQISDLSPRPELRLGLVAYRDYSDDYVTKVYDFTSDVEAFRTNLNDIQADGGGDEPEALTEAMRAAVNEVSWSADAVRLTFLVADAPPHIGQQSPSYLAEIRSAAAHGVKFYPIAASNTSDQAEYVFRQMAQQTLGRFIFLTYQEGKSEGTPGDSTEMHVDPQAFTVDQLDAIVVEAVKREVSEAWGAA